MINFIRFVAVLALVGVVVIATLFVLDASSLAESKEALQKTLLVLGIVALGGIATSFIVKTK